MKILFMGTPAFSVPTLERLLETGHEVVAVYCRADRRRGRGLRVEIPPVKRFALDHDLAVRQPERLREPAEVEGIRGFAPELIVVVAYGKILPPSILSIPRRGAINVHASLLPRHRGAAPIAWTLLAGDPETGVTTMQMDEGMDTGDILLQERCPVGDEDTAGDLEVRLAAMGAGLLVETLARIEAGTLTPRPQDSAAATLAPRISPEDARIDWSEPATGIDRRIRAFHPKPGAWTLWRGRRLKIGAARAAAAAVAGEPGRLLELRGDSGWIGCGGGSRLELIRVQPEGGPAMSFGAFARGRRIEAGENFG